jgi:hypothetical protein
MNASKQLSVFPLRVDLLAHTPNHESKQRIDELQQKDTE